MITTAEQYNANLHLLHNTNPPTYATLPHADNIYNIDVNTREIDAPRFLAVEKDNVSETIYFIIDRYADYMDLATTSCIITYTNALGKTRLYNVPFFDIYTYADVDPKHSKMIIPWCLDIDVAEASGEVEFFIQFFKIGEVYEGTTIDSKKTVVQYCLNTLPAKSKVLSGMTVKQFSEGYKLNASQYQDLLDRITIVSKTVQSPVKWTIIP